MTVLTTTLNVLLEMEVCVNGYNKLAMHLDGVEFFRGNERYTVKHFDKDEPINILDIVKNNGAADAIWCLRACQQDSRGVSVAFAEFCAADADAAARAARAAADRAAGAAYAADAAAYAADAAAYAARAAAEAAAAAVAAAAADAADAADAAAANAVAAAEAAAHAAAYAAYAAAAAARKDARERQAAFLESILSY
jgi:hypothetical protein